MTEKIGKFGCLSKTLSSFLTMDEEQRRTKYGKSVSKYYERIIKSVEFSFQDHNLAYNRLPLEQREKIDFRAYYDNMIRTINEHKAMESPEIILDEAINDLGIIRRNLRGDNLTKLAGKDFDKVIDWLIYLKSTRYTKS